MKKQSIYFISILLVLTLLVYLITYSSIFNYNLFIKIMSGFLGIITGIVILIFVETFTDKFEKLTMSEKSLFKEMMIGSSFNKNITLGDKITAFSPVWLSPIPYFLISTNINNISEVGLFLTYLGIGISSVFLGYLSVNIYSLYTFNK